MEAIEEGGSAVLLLITLRQMMAAADSVSGETEVLIVGAGPTGLTMACELRRHGIACRVIDRSAGRAAGSRAVDLQPRTLDVLQRMGIIDSAFARGRRLTGLGIYDCGRPLAELRYSAASAAFPFVLGLPQSETERLLEAHLESLGGRVERQIQLLSLDARDDGVEATVRRRHRHESKIQARWVVGCDGVASTTRDLIGVSVESRGKADTVITVDAELLWALPPDQVTLFLSDPGYVLVLPMGRERHSRIIVDAGSEEIPSEVEAVETVLADRVGAPLKLQDASAPTRWRVHRSLARRFQVGRVFLAGDAAHTHSPVGGHGLNQGVQDAFNLAWKLAMVVRGDATPLLLESYGAERRAVASSFLDEVDFEARVNLFRVDSSPADRDRLMRYASRCDPLRRGVLDAAVQSSTSYSRSPIVATSNGGPPGASSLVGQHAPHAPLEGLRHATLAERIRGEGFAVLLFSGVDPDEAAMGRVERAMATLAEPDDDHVRTYVVVGHESEGGDFADALIPDPDGALHRSFGASTDTAYVIRPDGYIGFSSDPVDGAAISRHLSGLLLERTPTRPAPAIT